MNKNTVVDRVIKHYGGQHADVARAHGITKQAVALWRRRGVVPAGERAYKVAEDTGIPLWELNPRAYRKVKV